MKQLLRMVRIILMTTIITVFILVVCYIYPLFSIIPIIMILVAMIDIDILLTPFGIITEAKLLNKEMEEEKKLPHKSIEYLIPQENIGKRALTIRPLGPSGQVQIDTEKFEALSNMGFIDKDTEVEIVDIRHHQYVVRPINKKV